MILVTGATGLVGGNLLWYLLQDNDSIAAIRRTTSNLEPLRTIFSFYTNNPDIFLNKIEWIMADVLDYESINNAMSDISVIYHCAAIVSLSKTEMNMVETNVKGTKNVITAALANNIKKLCFVSSIAACGKSKNGGLIEEKGVWIDSAKKSEYARSKYYSEQEVWNGIKQGLNAVIVNPGVILGVSGTKNGSSQLFDQVRKGLIFYTNGGSGYVDVQDVAKAMIQLTTSDISGERFLLVAENCSNKQILDWMADGFRKKSPYISIGKNSLLLIGFFFEFFGKIFKFNPLIDRGTARSVSYREFYSSKKVIDSIGFEFKPIVKCIQEVCEFKMENYK